MHIWISEAIYLRDVTLKFHQIDEWTDLLQHPILYRGILKVTRRVFNKLNACFLFWYAIKKQYNIPYLQANNTVCLLLHSTIHLYNSVTRNMYILMSSIGLFIVTWPHTMHYWCLNIYSMRVQEIRKFIHPRVSYSPRALPSGNMILLGE